MDYVQFPAPREANSQSVALTTTSAQSAVLRDTDYMVMVTALAFMRCGTNPTAAANTGMALAANIPYQIKGVKEGEKLAFVAATGTATAYITPIV